MLLHSSATANQNPIACLKVLKFISRSNPFRVLDSDHRPAERRLCARVFSAGEMAVDHSISDGGSGLLEEVVVVGVGEGSGGVVEYIRSGY